MGACKPYPHPLRTWQSWASCAPTGAGFNLFSGASSPGRRGLHQVGARGGGDQGLSRASDCAPATSCTHLPWLQSPAPSTRGYLAPM